MSPPRLSLVFPYYKNPAMLARHLQVWRDEWPALPEGELEIVIVDDGSPPAEAAAPVLADRAGLPPISLYRILEDRPWHQHAARNLGAHVAAGAWLLMTDMDHVVPGSTLGEVCNLLPSMRGNDVLTFGRVDAPAGEWHSKDWPRFASTRRDDGTLKHHVNSFVVSRRRYWMLGGYDEDLCGIYGTDRHFRDRLFDQTACVLHLADVPLIRVDRDVVADASTRDVERKTPGRAAQKQAVLDRKRAEGRHGQTTTLAFPWERVL